MATVEQTTSAFVKNWNGRIISRDGKHLNYDGRYGLQCMDLWNWWRIQFGYTSWENTADASSVWEQPDSAEIWKHFQKVPASSRMLPGDVPVWNRKHFSRYGHIAVGIRELSGGIIEVLEANGLADGWEASPAAAHQYGSPARIHRYSKAGLYGFIRPRLRATLAAANKPKKTTTQGDDDMPESRYTRGKKNALTKGKWKMLYFDPKYTTVSIASGSTARKGIYLAQFDIAGLNEGNELHVRFVVDDYTTKKTKRYRNHRAQTIPGTGGNTHMAISQHVNLPEGNNYRLRLEAYAFQDGVVIEDFAVDSYYWKG